MLTPRARPTKNALKICLKEFKKRFRRVFFCPGNHDLWVRRDTSDRMYPDSIAKLAAMHNVCQEVGADIGPAEVAQGVFVVPMFSWYNHQFDEGDPHPGGLRYDSFCEWPQALGGHPWPPVHAPAAMMGSDARVAACCHHTRISGATR